MARSRTSFKRFNRPAIQSYWVEFPFFLFGLGKFRRALKHGYQRLGFGVRGLYFASRGLRRGLAVKTRLAAEARFPYLHPLWTISTTFKYNYPLDVEWLTDHKTLVMSRLDSTTENLPLYTTIYLTPTQTWVSLDDEVFFAGALYESQVNMMLSTFNLLVQLNSSFYYLGVKLTF